MAGTSLLALIDDIASLLDDIATLTKSAASKTAGVLGDDLALNAEQVSGVRAERELPVVWAVAKGSALNKLIIVPTALALSYFLPALITPILMIGGAYLCFEGFEKIAHKYLHPETKEEHQAKLNAVADPQIDLVQLEKDKVRGAIRTDFILSGEIVVIALGTVQDEVFVTRAAVVATIAVTMTIGVYLLVAGIVKLDDLGLALRKGRVGKSDESMRQRLGSAILWFAPRLLKILSVLGTIAMFLVGGGILVHGIPPLARLIHGAEHAAEELPSIGVVLGPVTSTALNALVGLIAGLILVIFYELFSKLRSKKTASPT